MEKQGNRLKINRNDLLQSALDLMLVLGYYKTSIRTLMFSVGLGKGSFQNYFRTKREIALEVLDVYGYELLADLADNLERKDLSSIDRIILYFRQLSGYYTDTWNFKGGCMLGNMSIGLSDLSEEFRTRIDGFFSIWVSALESCIQEGQDKNEIRSSMLPHDLAELMVITWQGSVLRMKTMKSDYPLNLFLSEFLGSLKP